jgi:hypothetical protein
MRLQADRPIPVRVAVMIRSQGKALTVPGCGTVRYCEQTRGRYYVGIEFSGKLTWTAQQAAGDAA